MRLRVPLLAVLLVFASGLPAARRDLVRPTTWTREKDIPAKKYKAALAKLEQAVRLKPESGLDQQTYGVQFIDYLPYFYQGKCHLALGDYNSAIHFFNIEESKGKIKARPDLYRELIKLRGDALAQQSGRGHGGEGDQAQAGDQARSATAPPTCTRRAISTGPSASWPRRRSRRSRPASSTRPRWPTSPPTPRRSATTRRAWRRRGRARSASRPLSPRARSSSRTATPRRPS